MRKKIIDLTDEEMDHLCYQYHDCTSEGKVTCPLWHVCVCLRGFIKKLRFVSREIDL